MELDLGPLVRFGPMCYSLLPHDSQHFSGRLPQQVLGEAWWILQAIVSFGIWKHRFDHYIPIPPIRWNTMAAKATIWA